MRKVITITAHYIPEAWGMTDRGGKLTAFVNFVRSDSPEVYESYGNDSDSYREFEQEGFTLSKEVSSYSEGYRWLKENAEDGIGA